MTPPAPRTPDAVLAHYRLASHGLAGRFDQSVIANGADAAEIDRLDQLHITRSDATQRLGTLSGVAPGVHVLELGSCLGGAARHLAREFGCEVTGLDLAADYCALAEILTRRAGLSERVRFRCGDAQEIPAPAASFDVVWIQHSTMNVPDKQRLFAGVRRVLRPGGRLVLHEFFEGPRRPLHFPVPWARGAAISFLPEYEGALQLLAELGFERQHWEDVSRSAVEWFRGESAARRVSRPKPTGLDLLFGEDSPAMQLNLIRNLHEERVRLVEAVLMATSEPLDGRSPPTDPPER